MMSPLLAARLAQLREEAWKHEVHLVAVDARGLRALVLFAEKGVSLAQALHEATLDEDTAAFVWVAPCALERDERAPVH